MIDGIGSGTPGRLTPLCEETTPPTITSQRARPALDRLDAELDVAVVDQHVVADLEHRAEDGGADREGRPSRAASSPAITTVAPRSSMIGCLEVADPELRPLQVGDQSDRPAGARLRLAHAGRAQAVVVVVAVGHVEPRTVHAGGDQGGERLGRR